MGFLGRLKHEFRASAGDGASLSNPPSWFLRFLGAIPTAAGIDINERTALQIATVYGCVRAIAEDVAKMPVVVGRELSPRGKETLPKHQIARLMRRRPNPEVDAFNFRRTILAHALLWGNGFAEIERNGAGVPVALWGQRPDRWWINRLPNGQIEYTFTNDAGKAKKLAPSDVLHIRGLGFDGLVGYSVVTMARESLGLTTATERFGASYFGNGAVPQTVIKLRQGASIKDGGKKIKESWEQLHRGPDRARGVHVLEDGSEIQTIGIPPEDSQFLATRQFQTVEICRWFRTPPHKLGDLTRGTFSNIEHQAIEYVTDCLLSWMVTVEMEILHKLTMQGEEDIFVEHQARGLLRGDILTRYRAYAIGRQWGWESANDVREEEGKNPIEGGDVYLSPVNMQDAETIGDDPNADPADGSKPGGVGGGTSDPTDGTDVGARARKLHAALRALPPAPPKEIPVRTIVQAWRPALADVMRRAVRTDIDVAKRWAKRGAPAAWAGEFITERGSALRLMVTPAALALMDVATIMRRGVSPAAKTEDLVEAVVGEYTARAARDLKAATTESLPLMLEGWESRSEQDTDEAIAALCKRLTTEN